MKKLLLALAITLIYQGQTMTCEDYREKSCGYELKRCRTDKETSMLFACVTNFKILSITPMVRIYNDSPRPGVRQ